VVEREDLENLLADVKRRRDEATAEAGHAAAALMRLVGGLVPPEELDPDEVRTAADAYADAAARLRSLRRWSHELRSLLI